MVHCEQCLVFISSTGSAVGCNDLCLVHPLILSSDNEVVGKYYFTYFVTLSDHFPSSYNELLREL